MSDSEQNRRQYERDAANARYGEELTRVDRALPSVDPQPPTVAVDLDLRLVRSRASVPAPAPAATGGWRGWLSRLVSGIVAPTFARQQELNTAVVEQLEAIADAVRRIAASVPAAGAADRETLRTFLTFHSALVQCLQQIPPFVDTKDRMLEGALDEVRMAALASQRTAAALRRELESTVAPATGSSATAPPQMSSTMTAERAGASAFSTHYVGFEDLYRGSEDDIRTRQSDYVDRFVGTGRVVDIGCGRGEFLALLRDRGIDAVGVDANPDMVDACRSRGLHAVQGDGVTYLASAPGASLGGVTALQVVEHLEPGQLVRLLAAAHDALAPGGVLVLETINVACWVAYFESYIRDITHIRPLHPDTLKFLVVAAGFTGVDIHFRSPVAANDRLQTVDAATLPPALADLARTINRNVERLNDRLFTSFDYAVIGTKATS